MHALALRVGIAVPFLYYGAQLLAAPFFPGFSVLRHSASMLGSDLSTRPEILNTGAILTGLATIIAATAFPRALMRIGTHRVMAWIVFASMVCAGLASLWAGTHPLPDPRHNPGFLSIGVFALPVLYAIALWRERSMRAYLVANLVLMLIMVPLMSGAAGIDRAAYGGLLQRIAALTFFVPIAIVSLFLSRRTAQE